MSMYYRCILAMTVMIKNQQMYSCMICTQLRICFAHFRYFTTVQEMRDCIAMPPINAFFSKLTNSNISQDNYDHAKLVWSTFNCKNMVDYCQLYCQLDTILLAEVFENFRNFCMKEFGLDPAYYVGIPSLRYIFQCSCARASAAS